MPLRMTRIGVFVMVISLIALASVSSAGAPPPSTISPEWREVFVQLNRFKNAPKGLPSPTDLEGWRREQAIVDQALLTSPDRRARLDALAPTVIEGRIGGVPVLEVRPKGWRDDGRIAVYLHGGAYVHYSALSTLPGAAMLADRMAMRVISIDYSLAPAAKWPEVTSEVVSVLSALGKKGTPIRNIVVVGESAGGGLAAAAVLKMRDEGIGLPGALVLVSPLTDLTGDGDTGITLCDADPMLSCRELRAIANVYAKPEDQKNPYASPVYGNFSRGFPPTLIQVGTRDILLSDSVRLYQAIKTQGANAVLDVYDGMPHVFQSILPNSQEGLAAYRAMSLFIGRHCGRPVCRLPQAAPPQAVLRPKCRSR